MRDLKLSSFLIGGILLCAFLANIKPIKTTFHAYQIINKIKINVTAKNDAPLNENKLDLSNTNSGNAENKEKENNLRDFHNKQLEFKENGEVFEIFDKKKKDGLPLSLENSDEIPVVYFYQSEKEIDDTHYMWKTMRGSLYHKNKIKFITDAPLAPPKDLQGKFDIVDLNSLKTEDLQKFIKIYKGWGLKEPWESFNFRRFFYLREYMKQNKKKWVFFADSDVAVLTKLSKSKYLIPGCDAFIDQRNNSTKHLLWSTYFWSFWAGSSIMSYDVLNDFCNFLLDSYGSTTMVNNVLALKKKNKPFVCDMTLWYLYAVAADDTIAKYAKAENKQSIMPSVTKRHLCSSDLIGFDHALGFKKPGFKITKTYKAYIRDKPLLSIHFQGTVGKKQLLSTKSKFFTTPLAS